MVAGRMLAIDAIATVTHQHGICYKGIGRAFTCTDDVH